MTLISVFLLSALADIQADLEGYCGTTPDENGNLPVTNWTDVPIEDWYFGNDWDEFLANGTEPIEGAGGVFPAGFRPYTLSHYSEPPICMLVPESGDKKVEILLESPLGNANLCIHDASYDKVGQNNVGNIENCGTGKIYACFTAATVATDGQDPEDFGFYVSCDQGCEDSDVDVWIRVRISPTSWDQGKTGVANDLEHWCEKERGTHVGGEDDLDSALYYTYPSDLVPDEPSEYPFHIRQIFGRNAGSQPRPVWITTALAVVGLAFLLA